MNAYISSAASAKLIALQMIDAEIEGARAGRRSRQKRARRTARRIERSEEAGGREL